MQTITQMLRRQAEPVEVALARRAGIQIEAHYRPETIEISERMHPAGLGFWDAARFFAGLYGSSVTSRSPTTDVFQEAFRAPDILRAAEGFSTTDLSGILSNIANKLLVDSFMGVESAWRAVASTRSVVNLKQMATYALTGNYEYELIGSTGEIKSANLGEVSYGNQADFWGKSIRVTHRDLVNDDLGAFVQAPKRLGRGAALGLNKRFWTVFLAGTSTLFTSGHGNLLSSGGSSALSASSLASALALLRMQTDPYGEPLALAPRSLLVPPQLEYTAFQLAHGALVADETAGSAETSSALANVVNPVASAYLANANYPGNSSTAWYLLVDPKDCATVQVAFLDGEEMPTIDRADADFDTLGIRMRGIHAFGCSLMEYRAGVMSPGA